MGDVSGENGEPRRSTGGALVAIFVIGYAAIAGPVVLDCWARGNTQRLHGALLLAVGGAALAYATWHGSDMSYQLFLIIAVGLSVRQIRPWGRARTRVPTRFPFGRLRPGDQPPTRD